MCNVIGLPLLAFLYTVVCFSTDLLNCSGANLTLKVVAYTTYIGIIDSVTATCTSRFKLPNWSVVLHLKMYPLIPLNHHTTLIIAFCLNFHEILKPIKVTTG